MNLAQRISTAGLIALLGASLALMVWASSFYPPGFDEYWHIWYAECEPWSLFFDEISYDSHPPLTYVLLKAFTWPGADPLYARLLTIVTGMLSIPLMYRIARRFDVPPMLAYMATMAFGLSHVLVQMSVCVRSYSVTVLLLLLVLHESLRILQCEGQLPRRRVTSLALACILVPWTTYTGAIPLVALACAMLIVVLRHKLRTQLWSRWIAEQRPWPEAILVTLCGLGLLAWFYSARRAMVHHWTGEFLLQPGESVFAYFMRGVNLDLSYFLPISIPADSPYGLCILAVLILSGLGFLFSGPQHHLKALPVLIVLGTMLTLFVAGLLERHPFGGKLRHQYVLFPFLHLSLLLGLAQVLRQFSSRRVFTLAILLYGSIYGAWIVQGHRGPQIDEFMQDAPLKQTYLTLGDELQTGDAILVGTFSFVGMYANARTEKAWEWLGRMPVANGVVIDRFKATILGRSVEVLCNRERRAPSMTLEKGLVGEIRDIFDATGYSSIWVLEQSIPLATEPTNLDEDREAIDGYLNAVALRIDELISTSGGRAWRIVPK